MARLGQLQRIELAGFLSIRKMDLALAPLNLLIGPNGAGKSNFIKFFRFMGKVLHKDLQLHVRQLGGADAVLHFGRKATDRIRINLHFPPNSYRAELVATERGELIFEEETGLFHGDQAGYLGGTKLLKFADAGSDESGLPWNEPGAPRRAKWIVGHIEGWKRFHFDDTSEGAKVKQTQRISGSEKLDPDAGNLAAFLYRLWRLRHPEYSRIVETVRRVAPSFQDFILEPEAGAESTIRLRWKHRGVDTPFDVSQLSDGTLRFVCLAALLLQPAPPSVIVLDEPELGLHPYAIQLLAGMMRSAAAHTQIVAATQSVTLANQFGPEDLIVVDTVGNASAFRRLDPEALAHWLDEYRLGDLWEENLIGGTPD
jgi:predicted ATPase